MNLLQKRIEELGSAILNFTGNKVYIIGFYNSARLIDYLHGTNCWQSKGFYDAEEIDCSRAQDDSLIIIMRDNKEIERYQYQPFLRGVVKYRNRDNNRKTTRRIFTLRKCIHTKQYNIIYMNDNNEKQSIVCNDVLLPILSTQLGNIL